MNYLGNYTEDYTKLNFKFTTKTAAQVPTTLVGGIVQVYKGDATGTETSTGVSLSVDFDGITGLNNVLINLSADAFYETGEDYAVIITAGTVDGISVVGEVIALFSIENRFDEVNTVSISGDSTAADNLETMLDGTGGQVLSLGQLRINSAAAGGAIDIDNSGGPGISSVSSGGNGSGMLLTGNGNGHGIFATAGASGNGLQTVGGAGGGSGINASASDGSGIEASSSDGAGFNIIGGGGGAGLQMVGNGSGPGIKTTGGSIGHGIAALGGATSGDGINAQGQTLGDGMTLIGVGASQYDLNADIFGNITGNLSGSAGSVTGAVGSVTTVSDKTGYSLSATGLDTATTDGIVVSRALTAIMAALFGESEVSGSTVTFKARDGATTDVIVIHDTEGNRSSSELT